MPVGGFSFGGVGASRGDGQKQVLELGMFADVENAVFAPSQGYQRP